MVKEIKIIDELGKDDKKLVVLPIGNDILKYITVDQAEEICRNLRTQINIIKAENVSKKRDRKDKGRITRKTGCTTGGVE